MSYITEITLVPLYGYPETQQKINSFLQFYPLILCVRMQVHYLTNARTVNDPGTGQARRKRYI